MWWLIGCCVVGLVLFVTVFVVVACMNSSRISRMEEKYKEANGK